MFRTASAIATSLILCHSVLAAQETEGSVSAERIARLGGVDVGIQWGNVIVRPSVDGALHYRVVRDVSGPAEDSLRLLPEAVAYRLTETASTWILSIEREDAEPFVAALVVLEIPSTVHELRLSMVRGGAIAVDGFAGDLQVLSENGDVYLDGLRGPASVTAMNGEIRAAFVETSADSPITLMSRNGGLRLEVPAGTAGDFEVETRSGAIRSGLPMSIEELPGEIRSQQYRPRRATLTLPGNGPAVRLMTLNGDVDVVVR